MPEPVATPPETAQSGGLTADALRAGWTQMLDGLSTPARARFLAGHIASVDDGTVDFVLPTESQVKRCEKFRPEVEGGILAAFGATVSIALRAGELPAQPGPRTPSPPVLQDESEIDIHDLTDADGVSNTVVDRIADVFPGAEVLDSTPE